MVGNSSIFRAVLRRAATAVRLWRAGPNISAGDDLHLGAGTKLWAPDRIDIGDHVYIGKQVLVEANASIGSYVIIANSVALVGRHDHDFKTIGVPVRFGAWIGSNTNISSYRSEKIVVEDDVWIGYGSIILTGVKVGRGAIIAAGSVVTKDVSPYKVVAGNPARSLGDRFSDQASIDAHETMIASGRFCSSERGFDHFLISPGQWHV